MFIDKFSFVAESQISGHFILMMCLQQQILKVSELLAIFVEDYTTEYHNLSTKKTKIVRYLF